MYFLEHVFMTCIQLHTNIELYLVAFVDFVVFLGCLGDIFILPYFTSGRVGGQGSVEVRPVALYLLSNHVSNALQRICTKHSASCESFG